MSKKNKYAFVRIVSECGEVIYKLFDEVPTHLEVYQYIDKLTNGELKVQDSQITEHESTGFDRAKYLEHVNEVCIKRFKEPLGNTDEILFSFDKDSFLVNSFMCELTSGKKVLVETVEGIVLVQEVQIRVSNGSPQ